MKVEPTIADDIKTAAGWSIIGSLIVVFLYILLRFRKWQYSLGAVAAVFHDVLIVLSIFSLFYKILPFDMEIGPENTISIATTANYGQVGGVVTKLDPKTNPYTVFRYPDGDQAICPIQKTT